MVVPNAALWNARFRATDTREHRGNSGIHFGPQESRPNSIWGFSRRGTP